MFVVGEKVLYDHYIWGDDKTVQEIVTVINVISETDLWIENSKGTIRRLVKTSEIKKVPVGPFGVII